MTLPNWSQARRALGIIVFLAVGVFVTSPIHAHLVSAEDLSEAQALLSQESWSDLGKMTQIFENADCAQSDTQCLLMLVVRAEYLYASRRYAEADALLKKIGHRTIPDVSDATSATVEHAVAIARGIGRRHAGRFAEGHAILFDLLKSRLTEVERCRVLGELAYIKFQLGDAQAPEGLYKEQIDLAVKIGSEDSELYGRVGLALVAKERAQYDFALVQFHSLVRRLAPEGQNPRYIRRLSFVHANLGAIYKQLGQFQVAQHHYVRARDLVRQVDSQLYKADYSDMIASSYRLLGQHDEALRILNQEFLPFVSEPSRLYVAHREIALNLVAKQNWDQAEQYMRKAIALRIQTGNVRHIGDYFSDLGSIALLRGDIQTSIHELTEGLTWAVQQNDPESQWKNCFGMFRSRQNMGDKSGAVYWGKRTVNILQQLRSNLARSDDITQRTYLRQIEFVYQNLAALLVDLGRIVEAEQVLVMLKERELGELVRSNAVETVATQVDLVGVEKRMLVEQQRLAAFAVKRSIELATLERRKRAGENLDADDQARRQLLLKEAESWRAEYQRFLTGLGKYFSESARIHVTKGVEDQVTRLQGKVALDPSGAVGLHYVVSDEHVGIIVSTPRGSFGRFSSMSRTELNKKIETLRHAIVRKADTRAAAQALWSTLIAPVQADIQATGAKTLVLSLTDKLRYLPFAALQDEAGRYLIENYALVLWAAAADIEPRASAAPWTVSALGLTYAKPGFPALPAVRQELQSIVRTEGSLGGVLPGQIALDEQFDRARFEAALNGLTNVVHVASHFDFKPGDEGRSVLLLGQGDPISIGQFAVMDFSEVELFTLSACNTANGGGINENGAEVEGLAAAVLKQHVKSVLASLWKVADDSTASLMHGFYTHHGHSPSINRAQALQQAQLALLRGSGVGSYSNQVRSSRSVDSDGNPINDAMPTDPTKPWAHPYFWAPFVLSGSWL